MVVESHAGSIEPADDDSGADPRPAPSFAEPSPGIYSEMTANGDLEPPRPAWIYAICRIEPRFPSLALEKEFAQVVGRSETPALTDQQALRDVVSDRANRYLTRQLSWVATVEGLETYLLRPRDPTDLELLVESVRARPRLTDIDVVIGLRGPLAPPELANGLVLPIVFFDQIYSFDLDTLIASIPRPEGLTADEFEPIAEDVFHRVIQLADNAGATDTHRALNHAVVRYPAIYHTAADKAASNSVLTTVDVRPSRLSIARNIVDIILTFQSRETAVEEAFFARYDVTEEFPFLVTPLSPYYQRP